MAKVPETQSVLKAARLKAGLTVEDVSVQINIRKKYIVALEEENYKEIPAKVYIKGYIKMYSKFLGVDLPDYNAEMVRSKPVYDRKRVARCIMNSPRLNNPLFSKGIFILCAVLLVIAYYIYFNYTI